MKKLAAAALLIIVVFTAVNMVFYVVGETQQAVILQFGKPIKTIAKPGLHYKIPFIQKTKFFEERLLEYDANPKVIYTADEKNLKVNNYALWRITDPLLFYQSVGSVKLAQSQLDDIIYSEIRAELGEYTLNEIVSPHREQIMEAVTKRSDQDSDELGIKVVDVRIKRADLPPANAEAVYSRMISNRQKAANKYRADGARKAQKIESQAEKERTIILAEARKKARQLRGKGDARALEIYANSYNQNPEFYRFIKSLETYRQTLKEKTTLILGPDSELLKYFDKIGFEK